MIGYTSKEKQWLYQTPKHPNKTSVNSLLQLFAQKINRVDFEYWDFYENKLKSVFLKLSHYITALADVTESKIQLLAISKYPQIYPMTKPALIQIQSNQQVLLKGKQFD